MQNLLEYQPHVPMERGESSQSRLVLQEVWQSSLHQSYFATNLNTLPSAMQELRDSSDDDPPTEPQRRYRPRGLPKRDIHPRQRFTERWNRRR